MAKRVTVASLGKRYREAWKRLVGNERLPVSINSFPRIMIQMDADDPDRYCLLSWEDEG